MFKRLCNKNGFVGGSMGGYTRVTGSDGVQTISIVGETTVYTKAFKLGYGVAFGIGYKAAGAGTINLKIQLEEGIKHTAPTTEGSADSYYAIGTGVSDINSALTDTTARLTTLSPVPALWGRLKITGLTGNGADVTLEAHLFQQEYNT